MATSNIRNQNELLTRAYNGPHANIARLLLSSSDPTFLQNTAADFLSSETSFGTYTLNTSFGIFLLFYNVSLAKFGTRGIPQKEISEFAGVLLRVFKRMGFLGVVSSGGFLRGLQILKLSSEGSLRGYQVLKPPNKRRSIGEVEDTFLNGIDEVIEHITEYPKLETIAFLSGQCISSIPSEKVSRLRSKGRLLDVITNVLIESIFHNGEFISAITEDISKNDHKWTTDSPSYKKLQGENNHTLFNAPSISKAIARLIQTCEKKDILNVLERFNTLSITLDSSWEECPISKVTEEGIMDEGTKKATPLLWQTFKSILFSAAMIFKAANHSLFDSEYCGVEETTLILTTYFHLYFIARRFGLYGFDVYKEVFTTVLSQLVKNVEACNRAVKALKPSIGNTPSQQSRIVYYLLVVEQVAKVLDDQIIEEEVLHILYPYLRGSIDPFLFESSHATILAIFSSQKRVVKELCPFYANLLIEGYPEFLSVEQLRTAYSIVIESSSDIDDALAWYCLDILIAKIKSIPPSLKLGLNLPEQGSTVTEPSLFSTPDFDHDHQEADTESDMVRAALYLQRGHLLLTLIDQIKSVRLILLETLLATIKNLLEEVPSGIAKRAMQKAVFEVLSTGLDHTKKETGIKWWLKEGRGIGK